MRFNTLMGMVFVGAALCGVVIACSSGGSSSSSSGGGGSSDAQQFINSYCGYVGTCCGTQNLPTNGNVCRAFASLETGTYDPNQGQACLSAVQAAQASNAAWCATSTGMSNLDTACNSVFGKSGGGGSVAPGGQCTEDTDCAAAPQGSTVSCRDYFDANNAQTRICQVLTPGKAGDGPCIATLQVNGQGTTTIYQDDNNSGTDGGTTHPATGISCSDADNVYCDQTSMKCVALGMIGAACQGFGSVCVTGAYCDDTQKCAAKIADGADCSATGAECVDTDYCDPTAKKCSVKIADNAVCATDGSCNSGSCVNGKCSASTSSLALLCGSN